MGEIKWNVKNRFKVACDTEKSPQIQVTRILPTIGIEENILVITVAPHIDICPQGRVYPKKEIIISKRNIKTPEFQVILFLKDLLFIERKIWLKIKIKMKEAPLEWENLIENP